MEFLRVVKRRSVVSELIYILLNIALALAVLAVIWTTGSPWLAIVLVILSKWRVFAVRPRYWFAHVESNMVDIIVSIGLALLIFQTGQLALPGATVVQIVLAIIYASWLLLLKPRANRKAIAAQAAAAIAIGTIALAGLSYEWPSSLVVLGMWVIGYSSARHILVSHSEEYLRFLSLTWGFVFAEIGWLSYHWTIAYQLPFSAGLQLPQVTLLLLGISFLAERVYTSYGHHGKVRRQDIILPLLLTLGIFIVILFTKFNEASIGAL